MGNESLRGSRKEPWPFFPGEGWESSEHKAVTGFPQEVTCFRALEKIGKRFLGGITMSLTLKINAVWLLTWIQPNTGNYKTVNEKVNGTLAIYWKWWDIIEFTHRIMY